MAVLAVVHNIQANLGLTLHDAVDLIAQQRREIGLAERTGAARAVRLDQLGGAGQGANMGGANRHRSPFSSVPSDYVSRVRSVRESPRYGPS